MKYSYGIDLRRIIDISIPFIKLKMNNERYFAIAKNLGYHDFIGKYGNIDVFYSRTNGFLVKALDERRNIIRFSWYKDGLPASTVMGGSQQYNNIYNVLQEEWQIELCKHKRTKWPRVGVDHSSTVFITPLINKKEREELIRIIENVKKLKLDPESTFTKINYEIEKRSQNV